MLYEGSPDKIDIEKGCETSIANTPPSNSQQREPLLCTKRKDPHTKETEILYPSLNPK